MATMFRATVGPFPGFVARLPSPRRRLTPPALSDFCPRLAGVISVTERRGSRGAVARPGPTDLQRLLDAGHGHSGYGWPADVARMRVTVGGASSRSAGPYMWNSPWT